jgi:hypothetical protein
MRDRERSAKLRALKDIRTEEPYCYIKDNKRTKHLTKKI